MTQYWLFKSEPGCFSIDDLAAAENQTTGWDGVRNFQARNFLRDRMRQGDLALFYHSGGEPAVVGIARIVREGYPDATAFDPGSGHYDPRSTPDKPLWFMVDVALVARFARPVPLRLLRTVSGLEDMELLKKGSRLSVMPVSREEFEIVRRLGESEEAGGESRLEEPSPDAPGRKGDRTRAKKA